MNPKDKERLNARAAMSAKSKLKARHQKEFNEIKEQIYSTYSYSTRTEYIKLFQKCYSILSVRFAIEFKNLYQEEKKRLYQKG